MNPADLELIEHAKPLLRNTILSRNDFSAATVASAIRSSSGHIYTGVCIDLSCGIGFCAEHAAAAEMIKAGETVVDTIVAVAEDGILSPCGRCREFLLQVDTRNANARVIMRDGEAIQLKELLPHHWLLNQDSEQGAALQRLSGRVVENCGHNSTGSVTDAASAASAPSPCPDVLPPAAAREPWVS